MAIETMQRNAYVNTEHHGAIEVHIHKGVSSWGIGSNGELTIETSSGTWGKFDVVAYPAGEFKRIQIKWENK